MLFQNECLLFTRFYARLTYDGNMTRNAEMNKICIPVGCVPSAAVAVGGGVSAGGVCLGCVCPGVPVHGGCLPGGGKVTAQEGVYPEGGVWGSAPVNAGIHTPCEQNDRRLWKHNLSATVADGNKPLHAK